MCVFFISMVQFVCVMFSLSVYVSLGCCEFDCQYELYQLPA